MIKLIITDLDGTFLNNQGDYDRARFAQVKALMAKKGVQFAACTGKQCERVEELLGEMAHDVWIIGDSATRIKRNGKVIEQSLIDNALALRIIKTLEQANANHVIIACTEQSAVIRRDTAVHLKEKIRQSYTHLSQVDSFAELHDDLLKITVYDEAGTCPQTRPCLTIYEQEAYIVVSEAAWIDITAFGVHKGSTVAKLQTQLHVSRTETMAFGDGYNDLELLAAADYSFAMRNAFAETQAAAQFITGSNEEQAVLSTIERILALQA
ncbi:HAD family hydrolase [Utexia brackfieldae]|uniref:HAD family hydrolase n=1 Tax=Utexia brackfieldae TaxID=3074108 RepID=UPI00370D9CFD